MSWEILDVFHNSAENMPREVSDYFRTTREPCPEGYQLYFKSTGEPCSDKYHILFRIPRERISEKYRIFLSELRASHVLRETAEKFGDMGVNINIHKPPEPLDARKFTNVTRFAFIVLSQDESTLLHLHQASKIEAPCQTTVCFMSNKEGSPI
jgi:hypothetical protein